VFLIPASTSPGLEINVFTFAVTVDYLIKEDSKEINSKVLSKILVTRKVTFYFLFPSAFPHKQLLSGNIYDKKKERK
jgi:hypothetical protein